MPRREERRSSSPRSESESVEGEVGPLVGEGPSPVKEQEASKRRGGGAVPYTSPISNGEEDSTSLAELTASYGGGSEAHPHHKRRGHGASDSDRRRGRTKAKVGDAERRADRRRRGHRSSGVLHGGFRNVVSEPPHHFSESSFSGSSSGRCSGSRTEIRHHSLRQQSSEEVGTCSSIFAPITNLLDGINLKTVLSCMVGMAVILQLNQTIPHFNFYDQGEAIDVSSQSHRGAMVYENGEGGNESENEEHWTMDPMAWQQQQMAQLQEVKREVIRLTAEVQQHNAALSVQAVPQGKVHVTGGSEAGIPALDVQQQTAALSVQAVPQGNVQVNGGSEAGIPALDVQQQMASLSMQAMPQETVQVVGGSEAGILALDDAQLAPPLAQSSLLPLLSNFKDNWDQWEKTDIPMFWHIPRAGGSSIKDAMGRCHRFVQATEFGITDGHDADTEVAIVYPAAPDGVADTMNRFPFVNIDSTTVAGIQRAKSMGFADAQLADVVVSPFVFETNDLFTPTARGRLFSVFRHPIDRAASMFYYLRVAEWEPSYKPEYKDWTLQQYATSDLVENNWMTRQLSNQLGGELSEENLDLAMEVVRSKFLVGLTSRIEPTMDRWEKFFRWTYRVNPPSQEACRERLMSGGSKSSKRKRKPLKEGDPAWDLLARQNNFDLRLYAYIEHLFDEQEAFVAGLPDNFRNVDATCCKCNPATFPPDGSTCRYCTYTVV